jgi:hypothetical protein
MPDPTDPITELAAGAAQLHEVYLAYLEAGFTDTQAFELVKALLVHSLGGNG